MDESNEILLILYMNSIEYCYFNNKRMTRPEFEPP